MLTLPEKRAEVAQRLYDTETLWEIIADILADLRRPCCPVTRQKLLAELIHYSSMLEKAS